jgi:hypothetical protein
MPYSAQVPTLSPNPRPSENYHRDDILQPDPMDSYRFREPEIAGTRTWDTGHAELLFDSSTIAVTQGTCGEGEFSDKCVGIIQINENSGVVRDWQLTHTEITPPFPFKSGCLFWRKNTD